MAGVPQPLVVKKFGIQGNKESATNMDAEISGVIEERSEMI